MNVAIIDHSIKKTTLLNLFIKQFAEEKDIHLNCSIFQDEILFITNYKHIWDIIFIDPSILDNDNFTLIENIRTLDSEVLIVFITNKLQYAIHGYEYHICDYFYNIKTYEKFYPKMQRVYEQLLHQNCDYIYIKTKTNHKRVPIKHIYYIEISNHTLLYYTNHEIHSSTSCLTISALEDKLSQKGFLRINQSYLVNTIYLTSWNSKQVILNNGTKLNIGRTYRTKITKSLMPIYQLQNDGLS